MTHLHSLDLIAQDFRYAWRGLRRTPGFTVAAVVTLALGIGTTTAFFGLVDALVFRPTAVARIDEVHALWVRPPDQRQRSLPIRQMDGEALERTPPPSIIAVTSVSTRESSTLVQGVGRAEFVLSERVTPGYARVFQLRTQAGRWFEANDDPDAIAVISDRLWREWFGADREIVNRAAIRIGGTPYRVIGVAPPGFRGVQSGLAPTEVWRPLRPATPPPVLPRATTQTLASLNRTDLTFVRARAGIGTTEATGEIAATLSGQPDPDPLLSSLNLQPAHEVLRLSEFVALAAGVLAFAGLVFLAACANLANMLFARGTERAGEIAIRLSLGAGARGVFGPCLAEAAIVALAAASIGLVLAIGATFAFTSAFPTFRLARNLGVTIDLTPDYRVFAYAFAAGAVAALVVGMLTAWRASRVPALRAMGSSATSAVVSSRRRGLPLTFVSVQVTAAVLLVIGAGLVLENTRVMLDRRIHYDTSSLAAARVIWTTGSEDLAAFRAGLPKLSGADRTRAEAERRAAVHAQREGFFASLVSRARALPGVEAAAVADALPGGTAPAPRSGLQALQAMDASQGTPRRVDGSWLSVSPGFLETIGVPLLRGRDVQPVDAYGAPLVAVLSRSAAEALWPGEDAVGRRLHCCRLRFEPITVVGVADDAVSSSEASAFTRHANFALLAAAQTGNEERLIVVRARNPEGQVDSLRALVHAVDDRVPVFDAGPVDEFLLAGVAIARAQRTLSLTLGLLALSIAVFGIYGVVGYFVSRRTREFGLRLALGARPRQILKLVVDYSIHVILVGLLPAVLAASLGTRLFEHRLIGLMPNGITMWVVAPLVMLVSGVIAGLVPAARAARVDPNVSLREL